MKNKKNPTPFEGLPESLKKLNPDNYSWSDLSEFERQNIEAGLDDIQNGRVMSSEEFWKQLKAE